MKKISKNTFGGKMVLGVDRSFVAKDLLTMGLNIQYINDEETNFAITNIKGTIIKSVLTDGFIPIGIRSYGGIAYIVSYNSVSGEGEIGTYPSPDYLGSSGAIINEYRPLHNYLPDTFVGTPVLTDYGIFRTTFLALSLSSPVEIEIQPDYDGTVNLIISQVGWIINSGFSVLPGKTYVRIDRVGKDSNYYSKVNFVNTIPIVETSTRIMGINFEGVKAGGVLKSGNYRYYFYYSTADFNVTNIVGESGVVSCFIGETPQNIRGGKPNEPTGKLAQFTLTNLDTTFAYVKVYFTYSAGDNVATTESFSLDSNYIINGDTLSFSHTGFEQTSRINNDILSNNYVSISGFKTETQIQNRLFIANIFTRSKSNPLLETFARLIKVGHVNRQIGARGITDVAGLDDLYSVITDSVVGDGYDGGYYNSKNIYYKLGYWGGESYSFLAQFILLDGSLSPGFPVRGLDNLLGVQTYTTVPLESEEFFNETTGDNYRGVYRFPYRVLLDAHPIIKDNMLLILGVTFTIPDLTTDLGGGVKITDITKGIFFTRAERNRDAYVQGYLTPTIVTALVEMPDNSTGDFSLSKVTVDVDSPQQDEKVIPAIRGILEGVYFKSVATSTFSAGIYPVAIRKYFVSNTRMAFYSNDILNKELVAQVSGRNTVFHPVGKASAKPTIACKAYRDPDDIRNWITLYKTVDITQAFLLNKNVRTEYVAGESNIITSFGRFSSKAVLQVVPEFPGPLALIRMPLAYHTYYGITMTDSTEDMNEFADSVATDVNRDGNFVDYQVTPIVNVPLSIVGNIYPPEGIRTTVTNKQIQQVNAYKPTPITPRYYWNDSFEGATVSNNLEDALINKVSDRRLVAFGGDCFINVGFQRQYYSTYDSVPSGAFNTTANIGQSFSLVHESNVNAAFRDNEIVNLTEIERSFIPYYAVNQNVGNTLGYGNKYREYRNPESNYLNAGFSKLRTDSQIGVFDNTIPFENTRFDTDVLYSALHVNNAFNNGYRKFYPGNKWTYPKNYGSITRIFGLSSILIILQERGTSFVPINQRIQTGGDAGGAIFVESLGVLTNANPISELYGCQHQFGACVSDNYVYFYDAINKAICQVVITKIGGVVEVLSQVNLSSYLNKYASSYENTKEIVNTLDIRAHFEPKTKDIYFTFYDKNTVDSTFTVRYNEITKAFVCFHSFIPLLYVTIGDDTFSFNSVAFQNVIHQHKANVLRNNFYGVDYPSVVEFVVNENSDIEKEFQNLILVGNNLLPTTIRYNIQGGYSLQTIVLDIDRIYLSNAFYVREGVKVYIPLLDTVTNQSETEYLIANFTNTASILLTESRLRSKNLVIRLEYNTTRLLNLKSVLTVYDLSE